MQSAVRVAKLMPMSKALGLKLELGSQQGCDLPTPAGDMVNVRPIYLANAQRP
jgi:hypothetical protein